MPLQDFLTYKLPVTEIVSTSRLRHGTMVATARCFVHSRFWQFAFCSGVGLVTFSIRCVHFGSRLTHVDIVQDCTYDVHVAELLPPICVFACCRYILIALCVMLLNGAFCLSRKHNACREYWLSVTHTQVVSVFIPYTLAVPGSTRVVDTHKVMLRHVNAHPIVNAGFAFQTDDTAKTITACRLVYGGIIQGPALCPQTTAFLVRFTCCRSVLPRCIWVTNFA